MHAPGLVYSSGCLLLRPGPLLCRFLAQWIVHAGHTINAVTGMPAMFVVASEVASANQGVIT